MESDKFMAMHGTNPGADKMIKEINETLGEVAKIKEQITERRNMRYRLFLDAFVKVKRDQILILRGIDTDYANEQERKLEDNILSLERKFTEIDNDDSLSQEEKNNKKEYLVRRM